MTEHHPKPIEGHLEAYGFRASSLTDEERRQIAIAIVDAYCSGNGFLVRRRTPTNPVRTIWRRDPHFVTVVGCDPM